MVTIAGVSTFSILPLSSPSSIILCYLAVIKWVVQLIGFGYNVIAVSLTQPQTVSISRADESLVTKSMLYSYDELKNFGLRHCSTASYRIMLKVKNCITYDSHKKDLAIHCWNASHRSCTRLYHTQISVLSRLNNIMRCCSFIVCIVWFWIQSKVPGCNLTSTANSLVPDRVLFSVFKIWSSTTRIETVSNYYISLKSVCNPPWYRKLS